MIEIIKPDWPAPSHIHACTTTRNGGYSKKHYDSLNLGENVNDDPETVQTNRQLVIETLNLPNNPLWLKQIHSNLIINADAPPKNLEVDGSFAKTPNKVCVITTADCLPVLLTNKKGSIIAALHAGWRGLAGGIIEKGVTLLQRHDPDLMAWLGPAISGSSYEVRDDVREEFLNQDPNYSAAFKPTHDNKWLFDMYLLARLRLNKLGINDIYGGNYCTYKEPRLFYSFRRDGVTGRMATLIWMSKQH